MEKIIVIGGKGTSVNIAESIKDAQDKYNTPIELLGFSIDDPSLGDNINGIPILCRISDLQAKYGNCSDVKYLFSLYRPDVMKDRIALLDSLKFSPLKFTTFVHPSSYISPSCSLGLGNVVLSNSCINSYVAIGNFNIINQSVVIEHETVISSSNFFAAGVTVGAKVMIGNGNFFGIHSSIRENVYIGDYNFIGMGACLLTSVSQSKIMAGVPAKELHKKK